MVGVITAVVVALRWANKLGTEREWFGRWFVSQRELVTGEEVSMYMWGRRREGREIVCPSMCEPAIHKQVLKVARWAR